MFVAAQALLQPFRASGIFSLSLLASQHLALSGSLYEGFLGMKQAAALHDGNQRCLYTFFCSSPKDREFVVPQVPKKSVTVCNFVLCLVFLLHEYGN